MPDDLAAIRRDYQKWANRTVFTLLVIAAMLIAGGLVSIHLLGANSDRVHDIQQSRFEASYNACVATNQRHDNTIKQLDVELAIAEQSQPRRAKEIKQSRDFTILLIDALAPKTKDCKVRATEIVK